MKPKPKKIRPKLILKPKKIKPKLLKIPRSLKAETIENIKPEKSKLYKKQQPIVQKPTKLDWAQKIFGIKSPHPVHKVDKKKYSQPGSRGWFYDMYVVKKHDIGKLALWSRTSNEWVKERLKEYGFWKEVAPMTNDEWEVFLKKHYVENGFWKTGKIYAKKYDINLQLAVGIVKMMVKELGIERHKRKGWMSGMPTITEDQFLNAMKRGFGIK